VLEYKRGSVEDLKHLNFPLALMGSGFRAENAERNAVGHFLLLSVVEGDVPGLFSVENEDQLGQMFAVDGCVPDVTLMPCFFRSTVFMGKVAFPPTRSGCAVCLPPIFLQLLSRFCSPSSWNSFSLCGSLPIAASCRLPCAFCSSFQNRLSFEG
jgi:hypothetical protein